MRKWIIIGCFLPLMGMANDHYKVLFERGNLQYEQGNFDSALTLYSQIAAADYGSFKLYFNMGNTYFKLGNVPYAILFYERAKRLNPSDKDLVHNLAIANDQIVDKIEELPEFFLNRWWNSWANTLSLKSWVVLMYSSFFLLLISLGLFIRAKKVGVKQIGFFSSVFIGLLFVLSTLLGLTRKTVEKDAAEAIIIQPSLTVRSEPSENSTELFLLHEGTKVEKVSTNGQWAKISLPDGNVGWVRSSTFEII